MNTTELLSVSDQELLDSTRALVARSNIVEADLLAHLSEVETRKLHLDRAFPSMFEFCTEELGMSEGVAFNRIYVARLSRRLPVVLDCVRESRVHLSGLRLLAPHLSEANCADLLAEASGKSKRDIERLVTRFAPKPLVPATIRKLPTHPAAPAPSAQSVLTPSQPQTPDGGSGAATAQPATPTAPDAHTRNPSRRAEVEPLTPDASRLTVTIDNALRAKVEQALELMRHRVGPGNFAAVIDEALDLLIEKVKKERFGVGRRPRPQRPEPVPGEGAEGSPHVSRHIPAAIKRAVYERDEGRCTFVSHDGRRCSETGGLEFDHLDGFAITREHSVEGIALRCRPHNLHAAEQVYGADKMVRLKNSLSVTCPGAGEQQPLL